MCTKMELPFYPDSFLSGYSQDYKAALKASGMALNLSAEPSFRGLKAPLAHHPAHHPHHPHAHHPHAHHPHHPQLRAAEDGGGGGGYFSGAEGASASLKLAAPELERLIVQTGISSGGSGVIATTPTPPGQYFYPRGATEEQEGFADGFVKALDDLHKMNHLPPPNVSLGSAGSASAAPSGSGYGASLAQEPPPIYTNLTSYNPPAAAGGGGGGSPPVGGGFPSANLSYLPQAGLSLAQAQAQAAAARGFKEEPQTVPDVQSPPVSPINMEDQERIKVERKRLRNRLAATKCRKRKLERIARLEEKVKSLKSDNAGLSSAASALRDQVAQLKQKVLSHVNSGCQLLLTAKMQQSF